MDELTIEEPTEENNNVDDSQNTLAVAVPEFQLESNKATLIGAVVTGPEVGDNIKEAELTILPAGIELKSNFKRA